MMPRTSDLSAKATWAASAAQGRAIGAGLVSGALCRDAAPSDAAFFEFAPAPSAANQSLSGNACFVAGTQIATARGKVCVEDLREGDRVQTADSGLQPVRWISRTDVSSERLSRHPELRPVRISAGALGPNVPARPLLVSPEHRVIVRSQIVSKEFECEEILVAARCLLHLPGIEIADDVDSVNFVQVLFDDHEIVFADDAAAESQLPVPMLLSSMTGEAKAEFETIFPEMRRPGWMPIPARFIPRSQRIASLCVRLAENGRSLVEPLAHPIPLSR